MAYRLRFVRFCHGFVSTLYAFRPEIAERANSDINILFGTILAVGNATQWPRVTVTSSIVATLKALNVSTPSPLRCSRSFHQLLISTFHDRNRIDHRGNVISVYTLKRRLARESFVAEKGRLSQLIATTCPLRGRCKQRSRKIGDIAASGR